MRRDKAEKRDSFGRPFFRFMAGTEDEVRMDFYQKMALVCARIPAGRVATYGQIALLCGKPRNARQVGYGLREELAGDVPAHRVVNAKGFLSGAAYFDTADLQKLLLEEEGVEVERTPEGYRVDIRRFGWKNTLEDALSLREAFGEEAGRADGPAEKP